MGFVSIDDSIFDNFAGIIQQEAGLDGFHVIQVRDEFKLHDLRGLSIDNDTEVGEADTEIVECLGELKVEDEAVLARQRHPGRQLWVGWGGVSRRWIDEATRGGVGGMVWMEIGLFWSSLAALMMYLARRPKLARCGFAEALRFFRGLVFNVRRRRGPCKDLHGVVV